MSDNILSQSTDLGVGSLTVGHLIEIRNTGKPLLTIHYDGQITVAEHLKPNEIASEVLDIMKSMNMADPQVTKIRELQDRIKRAESFINRFLDPEDLGYAVNNYVRDDAREALGRERVESGGRKDKP